MGIERYLLGGRLLFCHDYRGKRIPRNDFVRPRTEIGESFGSCRIAIPTELQRILDATPSVGTDVIERIRADAETVCEEADAARDEIVSNYMARKRWLRKLYGAGK